MENIKAILVERDYKGIYERFALTPAEFKEEYPEVDIDIIEQDSYTEAPLVHIWYRPCIVGSEMWKLFFTDMTWELPTIDIECGNIAYVRKDMMKSLLKYLPKGDD